MIPPLSKQQEFSMTVVFEQDSGREVGQDNPSCEGGWILEGGSSEAAVVPMNGPLIISTKGRIIIPELSLKNQPTRILKTTKILTAAEIRWILYRA
ncbi:hypothetical protein WICPIJ_000240 [Wickerhamomyces pijperi]|uniref:Uncharacterized protein n=1 Tax=Wickerhamomyces pijperi TaxID=599730 RepID=A0A9P8QEC8_WICPI|nr:hypothetical protein WICPIJ_000240 [Wickerhamomyces pijperi]